MTTTQTPVDAHLMLVQNLAHVVAQELPWQSAYDAIEASARALAAIPEPTAPTQADREAAQRARMKARFANRTSSPASADFDLIAPNDVIEEPAQDAQGVAPLLSRAIELHEKAGMPWVDAEELALSEAGIDDAILDELIGEAGYSGLESMLTTVDELRRFTRSVLVHQPFAALRASSPAERLPLTEKQIHDWWARTNGLEDLDLCKQDDFRTMVRAVEDRLGIVTKEST